MQKVMQFTINTNLAVFTTRVIWVNLLVHQKMTKFTEGSNMKYNPQLGMAYQRFLITGAVEKVEGLVKAATDVSLAAKKAAADANGEATRVSKALDGIKTRLGVVEKRK